MKEKLKNVWAALVEILTCRKKIKELEKQLTNPCKIIENVIKRKIDWYDYEKLDLQDKIKYYQSIQKVLMNEEFENEVKHFLGDLIQEIAMSDADYNKDKMLRYSVNGVKTLLERLEQLDDPRVEEPTRDNINAVV